MAIKDYECPECLATIDGSQWRDGTGHPIMPPRRELHGLPRLTAMIRGKPVRPSASEIAEHVASGAYLVCPNGHRLPAEYADRVNLVLGLVGLSGSSKTTYAVSLVEELIGGALSGFGMTVELEERSWDYLEPLRHRLFKERKVLPPTASISGNESFAPLSMVLRPRPDSNQRATNLLVFDAAGEQLLREADQAKFAKFLYRADALFFFVPPGHLPSFGGMAEYFGESTVPVLTSQQMLSNVANQLSKHRPDRILEGAVKDVFAALLLTKADLYMYSGQAGFPARHLSPWEVGQGGLSGFLREDDARNDDMAAFMSEGGLDGFVRVALRRFQCLSLYAVSPTGCRARGQQYDFVKPVRCLDPFVAWLANQGLLAPEGGA